MINDTGEILRIVLDGDWSMGGVAEKHPPLTESLARLLNADAVADQLKSSPDAVREIDVSGITGFDACGCQLLALFVRTLRQNGFNAHVSNVPDTFRSKIHCLGFDHELNLPL